jgi:Ca2+-transporting ATPase
MQIQHLPVGAVYTALHTSAQGLTDDEAARRLREFGPNELTPSRRIPLGRKLLR